MKKGFRGVHWRRRKLREYSTGMKRKLRLIQAFQADLLLLILDEPTEGLYPLMQESFYGLVADVKRRQREVWPKLGTDCFWTIG